MGTQQILLIVLSVIIVGAAIAVGIQMFNNQAYSANQTALAQDAQTFATHVIQYYKTPISQGGAGRFTETGEGALKAEDIATYIGWTDAANSKTETESGEFVLAYTEGSDEVTITGTGNEKKGSGFPKSTTTITLSTGEIVTEFSTTGAGTGTSS